MSNNCCFLSASPIYLFQISLLFRDPFPDCYCVTFRFSERLYPGPGAGDGTRTRNLLITNQLLCQLSYASQKTIER